MPKQTAPGNTPKFPEHPEFNERLNLIRSSINRTFLDYRNANNHSIPSPVILKPLIEAALGGGSGKVSFLPYFENFITRSLAGQRIDPRSKKPVRIGVTKGYQVTLNHLRKFSKSWKRKLDFDTVDLEFHADFTKYLSAAPLLLSVNTIGSNIQRIKAVLSEATEKGANSNMAYKSRYFIKQSEDADTIYLNTEELEEMKDLNLTDNRKLSNVRDLFLVGCYTGLRFSDFSILKPENIVKGFIRITQTKTGAPVVIPVHPVVKQILKNNGGNPPRTISIEKLNTYLKELGRLMPSLEKIETKTITKGGQKVVRSIKKCEMLTTHAARRSFATNEFKAGTPTLTIMAITGHKTEKSFLRYIRVTLDEHAQKIKDLWDKRESNLRVV
jgi:integrase